MKRRKLRQARPKALFGEVAAAGITAAATLAAAGIGAAATAKAAKEQADASIQGAKQQAQSIEQTNLNNNQLQQQSQQFISAENEKNRQIQRDLQMNLQLQAGQLDSEQRRMTSRIQVKKGGKIKSRKPLRDAYLPLRGSNTGIKVTDGGYLEFIGESPEGYPLYKAHGDTHKQYHKVGKKYKSGIGIKIPGRETIEVENGETLADRLMTPHGDIAIGSRLKRGGIYPAQLMDAGYPVDDVINQQEISNILSDSSPVRRNRYYFGGALPYTLAAGYPMQDLGEVMAIPNVLASRRSMKRGGRCKAASGTVWGGWITGGANLGAGILSGLGSYWGNRYAAKAYPKAAEYLTNAYDNLKTIDMSGIRRDMFGNQHYMPVVRSTNYNVNDQLGDVSRTARSTQKAVNNNTLSSAARLSRMSGINDAVIAAKSKIYADKYNKEEAIKQANNAALNEAAKQNVLMDVEANKDFARTYVDLLKYNNDIVNEGITGKAQALADSIMGAAEARGAGIQGLLGNIGVGIQGFGTNVGKAYAQDYKQKLEQDQVLFGMPMENQVQWTARRGSDDDKAKLIATLEVQKDYATDDIHKQQIQMWIDTLKARKPKLGLASWRDELQDYMDGLKYTFTD